MVEMTDNERMNEMSETNETNGSGWTETDVEWPTRTRTGLAEYNDSKALHLWAKGDDPSFAEIEAEDIEKAVRSEMAKDIDDMVSAAVDRLRDELNDDLPCAVNQNELDCSEDNWQEVLDQEGPAETIRQLCTEMENNVDLVASNLGPVELGMPSDLERRVAERLKRPETPYLVKLARRIQDQTKLPRPVVAMMLRPFTYTGPVRDRLLKYSEEDVQTAQHLDFDVFR